MSARLLYKQCQKYAQVADQEVSSPQIRVEPADALVQKAVEKLKQTDPSYFVGVRSIVVDTGPAFGHVSSGEGQDPTIIHINLAKIRSEVQSKLGSAPQDQIMNEIVRQIAIVIGHEKGHVKSYNPGGGFAGGELPAQSEEHAIENKLKQ